ncbi:MAG: hypothetical protein EBS07_07895 [Sphingobacteriia bacterium]|nr:hypothetical protein [Sphingobacteriia bacterium]
MLINSVQFVSFCVRFLKGLGVYCLIAGWVGAFSLEAQITVNSTTVASQLVNQIAGQGIVVSNPTLNCPVGAAGIFTWTGTTLGMNGGIVLSTGSVDSITTNGGLSPATSWFTPGDVDLMNEINTPNWPTPKPSVIHDACVLEFDLIPNCDTIAIDYVFASTEFNNFVGTNFNDAFAFFISGPGIIGARNIALIPGTNTPITINSINNGPAGVGPCSNCNYYIDNSGTPKFDTNIEFNGFTRKLTAKQVAVPCQTYHIKFVIADGEDETLDSGVLLERGGFRCLGSQTTVVNNTQNPRNNFAVRECVDATINFVRTGDSTNAVTLNYVTGGSVVSGVDYTALPGSITIPAQQSSTSLSIPFFSNGGGNGLDSLLLIISNNLCGVVTFDTAKVYVLDKPVVRLKNDTTLCPGDTFSIGVAPSANSTYSWSPGTYLSNPRSSNPLLTIPSSFSGVLEYRITLTDSLGCPANDSIRINVIQLPPVSFSIPDTGCLFEATTILYDSTQVLGDLYFWDYGGGAWMAGQNGGPIQANWLQTGVKIVSLFIRRNTCVTDTVYKRIEILPLPTADFTAPTQVCWGIPDTLDYFGTTLPGAIYHWQLDTAGTILWTSPGEDTTLQVEWTQPGVKVVSLWLDQYGCKTPVVTKTIIQYPTLTGYIELDTFVCAGDTNLIETGYGGGDGGPYTFNWSPPTEISSTTVPEPLVFPTQSTTYTLSLSDGCGQVLTFEHPIGVYPLPAPPITYGDTVCTGNAAYLQGFPTDSSHWVNWFNYPTRQEQYFPIATAIDFNTPILTNSTTYWVSTEDTLRCRSPRIPISVLVNPLPLPDFTANPRELFLPNAITQFSALPLLNPGAPVVSWYWNLGNGEYALDSTLVMQYADTGKYEVSLAVIDANGCYNQVRRPGMIIVTKPLNLNIPNAFTPNGDGNNDFFYVQTKMLKYFQIEIFDRWGKLLYRSIDQNFRWDGAVNGEGLPEGVYVYNIIGTDTYNQGVSQQGTVTLIR